MLGVFAEFERSMIQERVRAGLARARANGTVLGRPKISTTMEWAIRQALANGTGIRKVAAALSVGVGTVSRIRATCNLGTCLPRPPGPVRLNIR
jgi:DNA invertase Pin-like site-specific DNA recombinase